jgi:hypothetical protein
VLFLPRATQLDAEPTVALLPLYSLLLLVFEHEFLACLTGHTSPVRGMWDVVRLLVV